MRYMSMRSGYLSDLKRAPPDEPVVEPQFTFLDATDKEHTISVGKTALYMIDVDMKRLMPWMYDNFQESFNLPSVLPGGSHCMMNPVTPEARPFMGPNLYITPPASFTHFHQDGHGKLYRYICVRKTRVKVTIYQLLWFRSLMLFVLLSLYDIIVYLFRHCGQWPSCHKWLQRGNYVTTVARTAQETRFMDSHWQKT